MKISLVGDFLRPDEARKVMAPYLLKELSKRNEVRPFNINRLKSADEWRALRSFKPDIIHYIPGASTYSFLIARMMKLTSGRSKTVMYSGLHAFHDFSYGYYYGISSMTKDLVRLAKTDVLIAQYSDTADIFKRLGCNVRSMVYSGVDLEKFRPVTDKQKTELRAKYGVDPDKFVVLHVGSIRKWRNVNVLNGLQGIEGVQVVVVGRTTTQAESDVIKDLAKRGVRIITDYTPDVNELYALSDCYVFPTTDPVGSIDVPLSVLEAMSTNLPVVSTPFGGLPEILGGKDGITFAGIENFPRAVTDIKESGLHYTTREHVLPYSWENIAKELETVYKDILG